MSRITRSLLLSFALAVPVVVGACAASHSQSALAVEAAIASVTLADDCGDALWLPHGAGDCAPDLEGPDGCGWCQQTSIQLSIEASLEGDAPVPFEVVAIRLRSMDGRLLDELDRRGARVLVDDEYIPWDERIAPGARLSVTYDTSAPDWTAIGGGDPWSTYGMRFRIEMVVRIDGVERTLEFAPASREPEIVT